MKSITKKYGVGTSWVRYARFHGIDLGFPYLPNNMISHVSYVNKMLQRLNMEERLEAWSGFPYTIVVFEMKDVLGNKHYAAHAIKGKVHPFVLKVADSLSTIPFGVMEVSGIGLSLTFFPNDFIDAIRLHKNVRIIKRLEENLSYFSFVVEYFPNEIEAGRTVKNIAEKAIVIFAPIIHNSSY